MQNINMENPTESNETPKPAPAPYRLLNINIKLTKE
jgi:hypothetical protein